MQAQDSSHGTPAIVLGALLGGLAVGLGAFAAHGMKAHFDEAQLRTFETGVRYQMYHALALLACGLLQRGGVRATAAVALFVAGVLMFSGSLYGLVWTGASWLGPVTPIGGVALLGGWLALVATALRAPRTAGLA